jgi:hypothetical protein
MAAISKPFDLERWNFETSNNMHTGLWTNFYTGSRIWGIHGYPGYLMAAAHVCMSSLSLSVCLSLPFSVSMSVSFSQPWLILLESYPLYWGAGLDLGMCKRCSCTEPSQKEGPPQMKGLCKGWLRQAVPQTKGLQDIGCGPLWVGTPLSRTLWVWPHWLRAPLCCAILADLGHFWA